MLCVPLPATTGLNIPALTAVPLNVPPAGDAPESATDPDSGQNADTGGVNVTDGNPKMVMFTVSRAVHPFASVSITEYDPDEPATTDEVVAPVLHAYVQLPHDGTAFSRTDPVHCDTSFPRITLLAG